MKSTVFWGNGNEEHAHCRCWGAGCEMAAKVHSLIGGRAFALNTDRNALRRTNFGEQLLLGPRTTNGSSAQVAQRGRRAADESREDLEDILRDSSLLILFAGLGGGTGTGATSVIARLAAGIGIQVFAAVSMPFSIEHGRRDVANDGLVRLRETGANVFVYDNIDVDFNADGGTLSIVDFLEKASGAVCAEVSRMVSEYGLRGGQHY